MSILGFLKEHPAPNELIATVSSFRPFGYVLVVSVDRLSRSVPEFVTLVDIHRHMSTYRQAQAMRSRKEVLSLRL
jgi:DNA invertase Pin-like site-specific DNA recombinase